MKTVRLNVFETNSSSEHVFTVTDKTTWERFKNGELLYDNYAGYGENPFKSTSEISNKLAAEYPNLPKPVIEAVANGLSNSESCVEFKYQLSNLIEEFSHNGFTHHYFSVNDMRDLTDDFTYGDTKITTLDDGQINVHLEWYE